MTVVHTIATPWFKATYARTKAAEGYSISRQGAIGIAFTPQERAVRRMPSSAPVEGGFASASLFLVQSDDLIWERWDNVSDSVEVWLHQPWFCDLAERLGAKRPPHLPDLQGANDPVALSLIASLKTLMLQGAAQLLEAEAIAASLAERVLTTYGGLTSHHRTRVRPLDPRRLERAVARIRASLADPPSLTDLARDADLSLSHFATAFRLATGASPYTFIIARRMERAQALLRTTDLSVRAVAGQVGYSDLPRFRTLYARHWGSAPSAFRRRGNRKIIHLAAVRGQPHSGSTEHGA
jgi:AraC family transcriptional regulator